eukprot:267043-Pleurochrysis_carterae.AAC.1
MRALNESFSKVSVTLAGAEDETAALVRHAALAEAAVTRAAAALARWAALPGAEVAAATLARHAASASAESKGSRKG